MQQVSREHLPIAAATPSLDLDYPGCPYSHDLHPSPYASRMLFGSRLLVVVALATCVWVTYAKLGILAGAGLVTLLFCGAFFARLFREKDRGTVTHDPAISTLVFPPESKSQQSAPPPK